MNEQKTIDKHIPQHLAPILGDIQTKKNAISPVTDADRAAHQQFLAGVSKITLFKPLKRRKRQPEGESPEGTPPGAFLRGAPRNITKREPRPWNNTKNVGKDESCVLKNKRTSCIITDKIPL